MTKSELAEYETRAKACDRGIDRDRCNECRIQLVLIAEVRRMDEALGEVVVTAGNRANSTSVVGSTFSWIYEVAEKAVLK